jgi:hypothetical protein
VITDPTVGTVALLKVNVWLLEAAAAGAAPAIPAATTKESPARAAGMERRVSADSRCGIGGGPIVVSGAVEQQAYGPAR